MHLVFRVAFGLIANAEQLVGLTRSLGPAYLGTYGISIVSSL